MFTSVVRFPVFGQLHFWGRLADTWTTGAKYSGTITGTKIDPKT